MNNKKMIYELIKCIKKSKNDVEGMNILFQSMPWIIKNNEVLEILNESLQRDDLNDINFLDQFPELYDEFKQQEISKLELLQDDSYINWMINYSHSKNRFYDEYRGCILKEEDKNQLNKLGLFVDGIIDYFEENDMDYDTYIFGFSYKIKYNNVSFEVGTINGNGPKYYVQKIKEINDDNYIDYNEIIAYTKEKLNKKDKVLTLKDDTKKED